MIFSITRNLDTFSESVQNLSQIFEMVENRPFFLRKYINYILNINYLTMVKYKDDPKVNKNIGTMCHFIIINFLRNKKKTATIIIANPMN